MSSEPVKIPDESGSEKGFTEQSDLQESLIEISNVIGRKWHPVIIYHLMNAQGSLRFSEIQSRIDGVSDKVLSDSLADLEEYQMVEREIIEDRPLKVEYSLTEVGESFRPIIEAVKEGRIDL